MEVAVIVVSGFFLSLNKGFVVYTTLLKVQLWLLCPKTNERDGKKIKVA